MRLAFSIILAAIAIFLIGHTWVPARGSRREEDGKVSNINAQPNTWFKVEITTTSGKRIACRARRGWPLLGPNRCPLEKFEHIKGKTITVLHDGKRPYEVMIEGRTILSYADHRQAQTFALSISGLLLAMAWSIWKRK